VLGVATLALSTLDGFQHHRWRSTRALAFALLGLCGVFPWAHVLLAHPHIESVRNAMLLDIAMGGAYLGAAVVFSLRVPEKWYPGRFDYWLNSHQIFHVFVVLGCYIHYLAAQELVRWRDASGGCALELTKSALVHEAVRDRGALIDLNGLVDIFEHKLQALWRQHQSSTAALRDALLSDGVTLDAPPSQCAWGDAPR
jgi:Haemolysin-III related